MTFWNQENISLILINQLTQEVEICWYRSIIFRRIQTTKKKGIEQGRDKVLNLFKKSFFEFFKFSRWLCVVGTAFWLKIRLKGESFNWRESGRESTKKLKKVLVTLNSLYNEIS
jgi:hypothetical protein